MSENTQIEQEASVQPTPITAPKKSGNKIILIIVALIVFCSLCCGVLFLAYSLIIARSTDVLNDIQNQIEDTNNTKEEAITFNDKLIAAQQKIQEQFMLYSSELKKTGVTKAKVTGVIEAARVNIIAEIENIEDVKAVNKGEEFKNAGLDLFNFYEEALDKYVYEIVDAYFDESLTSTEANAEITRIGARFATAEQPFIKKFQTVQQDFAEEYNFPLIKKDFDTDVKLKQ